ncbi:MAG: hypothetical protein GY803_23890 [Chloroflexi bacterium]|nr:hypothetical protein [Chloroflexota bacterium]
MKRALPVVLFFVLVISLFGAANLAQAQSDDGRIFIRGAVYEDKNGDGKCFDTGEAPLADIPLELSQVNSEDVYHYRTDADGLYGGEGLAWGSWLATVKPPAGSVVTSDNPLNVYIHNTEAGVSGVVFCVSQSSQVTVLLPESGGSSPLPAALAALAVLGLLLIGFGWRKAIVDDFGH